MICSSSAQFSEASVISPARNPCGESRSVDATVNFAAAARVRRILESIRISGVSETGGTADGI